MTKIRVSKTNDDPIVKRRPGNRFKALINAEDYDPESMANYANKIKFVKRGGKEYVKVKGKFTPQTMPKEGNGNSIKEPPLLKTKI